MRALRFSLFLKLLLPSVVLANPNDDASTPVRHLEATKAFINEIHYSNKGPDVEEYLEIAIPSDKTIDDISEYKVELYGGRYGKPYATKYLSAAKEGASSDSDGFTFWQLDVLGIRNGGDYGDGIALVDDAGTVLEFLSYEGTITAKRGSAEGMTSTPIGVLEYGAEKGTSLQRGGEGCAGGDFLWQHSLPQTFGGVNKNQVFKCGPPPEAIPQPSESTIYINEIHYENIDDDQNEFVEVAYEEGMDISLYSLEFYNGGNGNMYRKIPLEDATRGSTKNGLSFCHVDEKHLAGKVIQNGLTNGIGKGGDGVALVGPNNKVMQFLSYEGVIKGREGAAAGMESVDIGANEDSAPLGTSLQLGGTGCSYEDFSWQNPQTQTMGEANLNQIITCKEEVKIEAPPPQTTTTTEAPTGAPATNTSGEKTYIPGEASVVENGLLLSTGLTAKIIATELQPVKLAGGGFSSKPFHKDPDGAAVFKDRAPNEDGWIYVSNAEDGADGGVGALYFNKFGEVIKYEKILDDTSRNCGGGKTFWGTWITCEETPSGQIWEVDPWGEFKGQTIIGIEGGDKYESAAYDNRDPLNPRFYITTDQEYGTVHKFTPDQAAVQYANSNGDYTTLLHSNETGTAKTEFLVVVQTSVNNADGTSAGTYYWTENLAEARQSAYTYYQKSEGIDIRDGQMFVTCKKDKKLFIFDLDGDTYTASSTVSGVFNNQPDQVARLLGDGDQDILYFCEDGSSQVCGVHGRDSKGGFYTILESAGSDIIEGETTGLAFSPDNRHMYVSFQKPGYIFDVTRKDGYPFGGERLDIKYHSDVDFELTS